MTRVYLFGVVLPVRVVTLQINKLMSSVSICSHILDNSTTTNFESVKFCMCLSNSLSKYFSLLFLLFERPPLCQSNTDFLNLILSLRVLDIPAVFQE